MDGTLSLRENVSLAPLTTFRVGGPARFFCEVTTVEELKEAVVFAEKHAVPVFILGGGSNVLINDGGFPGLVIKIDMRGITYADDSDSVLVSAGAGEDWDAFVEETVKNNLWGLENLSLIPGSVGASPVQNVGAYGVEVKDVLYAVQVYDKTTHTIHTLAPHRCALGYRDSMFKHEDGEGFVVLRVIFRLSKKPNPRVAYSDVQKELEDTDNLTPEKIREAIIAIRTRKLPDPTVVGTAGSFFKNPVISEALFKEVQGTFPDIPSYPAADHKRKIPLAWILDHALHLNGLREGAVGVWPTQPLVVVNYGGAHAKDIRVFTEKISKDVFAKTKIKIEHEVVFV